MPAARRLSRELSEIIAAKSKIVQNIESSDETLRIWTALLVPEKAPYNKGAFRIELNFPQEYPFLPPKVSFKTKIYHPNVDEKGQVCLTIISSDNWKPTQRAQDVLHALVQILQNPEPNHALRSDVAEEFVTEPKVFMKAAEEFTKKHAEKRPA